jgi:arylformamidase
MTAVSMSPEDVERGYNNRAAVPEHPHWLGQYTAFSAATRDRYKPQADLRYGPGPLETLDLYLPAGKPRGTLVFVHGGYWRALDKSDFQFVAAPFVENGYAAAIVNYDLCPAVSIADIANECRRALVWVGTEGPRYGAAANNVVVAGHSAGGHLAAMMYTTDWTAQGLSGAPFVGGVTLSGVHDLTPMLQYSFNTDFRLDELGARKVSPVFETPQVDAPLLIAAGADETSEFLRQSQLLWDAWPGIRRPQPGPLFVPATDHFSVVAEYANPASALTQSTLALFQR